MEATEKKSTRRQETKPGMVSMCPWKAGRVRTIKNEEKNVKVPVFYRLRIKCEGSEQVEKIQGLWEH